MSWIEYLGWITRWIIGLVFLFAAVGKIVEPQIFAQAIERYQLLPVVTVNIVAIVLPWIELFAAVALLLGVRVKASAIIVGVLLIVFTVAVASAWLRGINVECGCFTQQAAAATVGIQKILENMGLLVVTAVAYFTAPVPQKQPTLES